MKSDDAVQKSRKENALLQSVLQGRLDAFRASSLCSPLDNAGFKESEQSSLYASGVHYVLSNGVLEKNEERIISEEEIDETIEHFVSKNLPFTWWSPAKILETKGLQLGGILTGIAIDISEGVLPLVLASNLKITIVGSYTELTLFSDLGANAFGMSGKAQEQYLALNEALMKKDQQIHFLAYVNDIPAGTVTLSVAPSSAGIWNLATRLEYRKHGIGFALVHAALIEAKRRDYHQVMAILTPKGMAWGLFTKIGFRGVCEFPFHIYGVDVVDLE